MNAAPANGKIVALVVVAALVVAGVWLAFAAAGGGTAADAGRVQFYQGPVCRFQHHGPSGGEGCPRRPARAPSR